MLGWKCPQCGTCHSPFVSTCPNCVINYEPIIHHSVALSLFNSCMCDACQCHLIENINQDQQKMALVI